MGRDVHEIELTVIKNNSVILDLRYGVAYRAAPQRSTRHD